MGLEVNVNKVNDVVIVKLMGNLDTNTAPIAETDINKLLDEGAQKMIISLDQTNFVSSAGLRIFLATAKKITASGGVLKLCGANDVVQEILDISGFSTILDVKKTEEEALNAL